MLHEELTEKALGCAFKVANSLGCGFLEKVYENAMMHQLRKDGLQVEQQFPVPVYYEGVLVGEYVADLIVEEERQRHADPERRIEGPPRNARRRRDGERIDGRDRPPVRAPDAERSDARGDDQPEEQGGAEP